MRHFALLGVLAGWGIACSSPATIRIGRTVGDEGVPRARLAISEDSRVAIGAMSATASARLRAMYTKQAETVPPPAQLVPTDGSELALEALVAKVDIDGPLARTELHFTFANLEARQREGRFSLTLPPAASVARFAMKISGEWREARVVSREKGRQVYETILKQQRDPALLERDLGNQFSARVFPIAAHEKKEIVLAYEHAVAETQPYVLALRGLPVVSKLTVDIDRDGAHSKSEQSGRAPEDVIVAVAPGSAAVTTGDTFVARIELPPQTGRETRADLSGRVLVLVDTSASRTTVMGRQAMAVRAILAALPAHADVRVAAFDHEVTELFRGNVAAGRSSAGAGDIAARLFDVGALGASDLGRALAYAANANVDRVILVGDGMATLGEREPAKLAALVKGSGIHRVDALQVGATIDRDTLGPIVAAGGSPGAILDGRDLSRATRQLAQAIRPEQRIAVAGATTWPATTRGVAPGDPVWVFGRRTRLAPGALRVTVGDHVTSLVPLRARADARVKRAVAGAQVATMTDQHARLVDGPQRERLAAGIEKLALEHALVSMQTSLIVLESDADEERFLGKRPAATGEAAPPRTADRAPRTFEQTLGDAKGSQADALGVETGGGEVIVISDSAPTIDPGSTRQGITITRQYLQNIPVPGRTFESAIGTAISGSTSLENTYVVDGVSSRVRRSGFAVRYDVMSPLAHDMIANSIRAGGMFAPPPYEPDETPPAPRASATPTYTPAPRASATPTYTPPVEYDTWKAFAPPHDGTYHFVRQAIAQDDRDRALTLATAAELANPGDITNVLALGEALEARGAYALAARAYGSIIDMYPNRAELLRAAGQRFDALAPRFAAARDLAIDAYRRSIAERPDHAHTYRLLALSLLLANRQDADNEVLETLRTGASKTADPAVGAVLAEDRAIAEAVLAARHPERARELVGDVRVALATTPSLRIILAWETDANDVDLHVRDRFGDEAFFSAPSLPSGGTLLQDLTRGYGPEMFTILNPAAFPYRVGVHYYSRGPMGVGLGTVQAVRHDGKGGITVQQAPFVIQADQAMIELPAIMK
ncbi:MAG: VIT domain-containing protein [Kofleriaceae bacterium]